MGWLAFLGSAAGTAAGAAEATISQAASSLATVGSKAAGAAGKAASKTGALAGDQIRQIVQEIGKKAGEGGNNYAMGQAFRAKGMQSGGPRKRGRVSLNIGFGGKFSGGSRSGTSEQQEGMQAEAIGGQGLIENKGPWYEQYLNYIGNANTGTQLGGIGGQATQQPTSGREIAQVTQRSGSYTIGDAATNAINMRGPGEGSGGTIGYTNVLTEDLL